MKDTRFYLEFDSTYRKRKGEHSGNVFAAFPALITSGGRLEGIGAVFFHPNSAVCGCAASLDYLRTRCKRISERRAREVHPELFRRLDAAE